MRGALLAGAVYFLLVFAAGFALGVVRTLWLAPMVGPVWAVAIELPLMLGVSWLACGACIKRLRVVEALPARAAMGASAFAWLMAAELGLFVASGRGGAAEFVASLATPEGALGLAGQVVFALFPLVRRTARAK